MKKINIAILIFTIFMISGCISGNLRLLGGYDKCLFKEGETSRVQGNPFYNIGFFIDKNNPKSKKLNNSTEDYGYVLRNKKEYIIKAFNIYECDKEIPISDIYYTGVGTGEHEYISLYFKNQEGSYIKAGNARIYSIAILECYNDGYCKTYNDFEGKSYYAEKSFLKPMSKEQFINDILNGSGSAAIINRY